MNRLVASIILASAITVSGEFSFGVNLSYLNRNDITDDVSTLIDRRTQSNNSFSVGPYFGIYPGEILEISPFIRWSHNRNSTKTEYVNLTADTENSSANNGLDLGCGFFFHVIRGDVFGVSLGPQVGYGINFEPYSSNSSGSVESVYDTYYDADIWIACPFNIDLHFSKSFSARLTTDLIKFNYYNRFAEYKNSTQNDVNVHRFEFDVKSIFQPWFGVYFTF